MATHGLKQFPVLALLILGGISPGLMAQASNPSVQTTVDDINQILSDYPDTDPSVVWRQQRLEVRADEVIHTTATKGLDGSIQENSWTAKASDVKGVSGSEGRVFMQCRDDVLCAQLSEGPDREPTSTRARAITLVTTTTGDVTDRLVTACKRLADLLSGSVN
jgi:hypothetical protein